MTKEIKEKLRKQRHDDRMMAKRARRVLVICKHIICGKTLTNKEKEILEKYFYDRWFDLSLDEKDRDRLEAFAYCRCWDAGMKLKCARFLAKNKSLEEEIVKPERKQIMTKTELRREKRSILKICKRIIRGKTPNEKQKEILNKYFKRMFLFTVDNEKMLKSFVYCTCRDAGMKRACENFVTTL